MCLICHGVAPILCILLILSNNYVLNLLWCYKVTFKEKNLHGWPVKHCSAHGKIIIYTRATPIPNNFQVPHKYLFSKCLEIYYNSRYNMQATELVFV